MRLMHRFLLVLCASISTSSQACLWDSDTLATEHSRFPEVVALMTGLFPRHSQEYHQWRLQQKKALVDAGKATALDYDDLAVSQHKLGDHKAAIATMTVKEKRMPGIYETYSNLGTFYIYTGELRTAVLWIDRALSVNPNAHFGREKYQRWLVLWIQETQGNIRSAEEVSAERMAGFGGAPVGFAAFVARQEMGGLSPDTKVPLKFTEEQRKAAIRGVTGMMYFADFDNPILQEALGDLLSYGRMDTNASQLAALCYLHAAAKAATPEEKARLNALVSLVLRQSHDREPARLSKVLTTSLAKGMKHQTEVRAEEMAWLAAGKDATLEFQKKYLQTAKAAN